MNFIISWHFTGLFIFLFGKSDLFFKSSDLILGNEVGL